MASRTPDNPLVTVGICCHNAAGSIEKAIGSALEQTWRPIEIIVVDDASQDTSPVLLSSLEEQYDDLSVVYHGVNSGVAAARNTILSKAKGSFVAFFDDDDESSPDRVTRQVARIRDYEKAFADGAPVICHTARKVFYEGGVERLEPTMGTAPDRPAPHGEAVAKRILAGMPLENAYGACPTCSQMARRSVYLLLGGFDEAFRRHEDTELNVRLALQGAHFPGIDAPLVRQRMTRSDDKGLDIERQYQTMMLEKYRTVLSQWRLLEFCRRWADLKYAWQLRKRGDILWHLTMLILRHPHTTFVRLKDALRHHSTNSAYRAFFAQGSGQQ